MVHNHRRGRKEPEQLEERIGDVAQQLRGVHLLSGAGHWVQQERADEVNELLVGFLRSLE